jgi:CheY-like chemotaxis protein
MVITLTENAIKHGIEPSARGGRIDVLFERDGDNASIVVADTGAGLADGLSEGGIGLANIRERIALLYGDRASCRSRKTIPRIRARIVHARSARAAGAFSSSAAKRGALMSSPRHCADCRRRAAHAGASEGQAPRGVARSSPSSAEAQDGDEAVAMFDEHRPQIAFLDIRMPGRSGLEVAARSAPMPRRVHHRVRPIRGEGFRRGSRRLPAEARGDRSPRRDEGAHGAQARHAADRLVGARRPAALERQGRYGAHEMGQGGRRQAGQAHPGRRSPVLPVGYEVHACRARPGRSLIRTPLKELLSDLDPEKFWQVHRGTIVNLDAVSGVLREDAERQFIMLKNRQEKLPISRQFTHLFKQM